MSQPDCEFVRNLGDQGDPVEYGGLFLYRDRTGVYDPELEKLEEPPGDDRCEECEDEPDAESSEELERLRRKMAREYEGWLDDHPDAGVAECETAEAEIRAKWIASIEAEKAKIAAEHAAWQEHIAEHERWTVYRVSLDRFKIVREYDIDDCRCEVSAPDTDEAFWRQHERLCPSRIVRRYLVDASYQESWRKHGTPAQREPWFYDSLGDIAKTMSTTKFSLVKALCGKDERTLALAWRDILDYHGWENGDSYPLRLSRPEVEKRYEEELR